jgi:hypothetical protein
MSKLVIICLALVCMHVYFSFRLSLSHSLNIKIRPAVLEDATQNQCLENKNWIGGGGW